MLDDAPLPFVMQHAARISGVRKRFTSLNSVLKSIQRRIDNIDRTLSAASLQGSVLPCWTSLLYVNLFAKMHQSGNAMIHSFTRGTYFTVVASCL